MNFIHPNAKIGQNVKIEHFAYVDEGVEIGDNTWVGPHATIMKGTIIGKNCKIFPGAVVGAIPQDLKYAGEESVLVIEDNVTIRECCTLNRGTAASMLTKIGANSLLMAYVHVAHDCIIGKNCIIANNVNLAGHITIGNNVVVGGVTAVHQFVKIGDHVIVGGGSLVRKDIPPFVKAAREPLSYAGVNSVGLSRRGFAREDINMIHEIYRILFVKHRNVKNAVIEIETTIPHSDYKEQILLFIRDADRGVMKGYKHS
ncbi:MAG: acyl-ACP--UDP-N-acetylglucosamine O-acyltransferase [Saprospiraceae bacterium]|nr:acyl-ACP--UDP-N-acetylglucosamine O-acyltransferase [Saprospiraceae bacterium]